MGSLWRQTLFLLYRNLLLKIRTRKTLLQELLIPATVVLLTLMVAVISQPRSFDPIPYDKFHDYSLLDTKGNVSFLPNASRPWVFTPNNSATQKVMEAVKVAFGDSAPTELLAFASEDEMVEAYKSQQEPLFSTCVVFGSGFPDNLTMVIRMPYYDVPETGSLYAGQDFCRWGADSAPGLDRTCPANYYLFSGFAALQTVLQNVVASLLTNQTLKLPDISVRMFPKPSFTLVTREIRLIIAILYVVMYSIFIAILLTALVQEKEKKIKEVMLMMGMSNGAFWLAWFLVYVIIMLVVSALITVSTKFVIFPKGNFLLIFLIMFFYGMSIVGLSFMLTPFFNKGLVAGTVGSLATMLLALVYIPFGLFPDVAVVVKWLVSFLCPIGFALAIDQAMTLDQLGPGIQFDNLGLEGFPPYLAMLAIDTVLYLLLAVYFDSVVPGTYGQRKPLCFCFMPSYWRGGSKDGHADSVCDLETVAFSRADVELVSPEMRERAGIRIRNLSKTYKGGRDEPDIRAVRGMTLDIYEDQITCLLGHNGAGKTTLINTLTGLIQADSGQAAIYGYDSGDPLQMQKIRSMMGVCPQDNTLFDHLTPREHLKVYAGLKGVPFGDINAQVEKLLEKTQLAQSAGTKSKDLSGGQKRKLCVGIALIGDPKVVFLDEPSSGMDPYSRRQMWNLLKSQRQGRITVLTTHFMDEADILADRKAVMSQGSLRCCGSSLFLKNRFGIGYHLGMVVEQDVDVERITELVTTHIPEGKVSRSHGMELAYILPLQDASRFPELFGALEATSGISSHTVAKQLGIQSYGVSMTTLEEVFLKLSDEEDEEELKEGAQDVNGVSQVTDTTPFNQSVNTDYNTVTRENDEPVSMAVDHLFTKPLRPGKYQLKALCKVQFRQMLRNPATYFTRLFFPIAFILLGTVLAIVLKNSLATDPNSPVLTLEPGLYLESSSQSSLPKLSPLLYQDNLTDGEDIKMLVDQFDRMKFKSSPIADMSKLMEVAAHSMATVANNLGTNNGTPAFLALYNDTAKHSLPVLLSILSNALVPLETPDQTDMVIASHPLPTLRPPFIVSTGIFLYIFLPLAFTFLPVGFVTNVVKERQEKVRTQLRVSGVTAGNYWTSHLLIDIAQMYGLMVVAIIVLLASGLSTGGTSLTTVGGMVIFVVFMIIYIPTTVMFSYCVAFLFKEYKTSQTVSQLLFFFVPLLLMGATILIGQQSSSSTSPDQQQSSSGLWHIIFCLLYPPYSMFGTVYYIDKIYETASQSNTLDQLTFGDYFAASTYILPSLICIVVSLVMVFFLLRVLEINSTGGNWRDAFFCSSGKVGTVLPNHDHIENEDSDVTAERDRVEAIFKQGSHPECVVAAKGIRKEYYPTNGGCCKKFCCCCCYCSGCLDEKPPILGGNAAVRNLTLSVNEGEVLGLLGPNGAGKTTSMNVITADTKATRGQIRIAGHDITSSLSDAFRAMGYCPQHDPLFENVTVREHLEAYALIKGIHPDDIKAVTDHYLEALGIRVHADKKSQYLSGGTKRKLCFAISMLGRPKIVFLDEPSTGMDPHSKRFVWNTIIASFRDDRGAILTTHSMEEADAVCSRVGIMVLGRLVCLGTTQHLKDKYGGGYVLEVKLNPGEAYYSMDHASGQATQLLDQHLSALDSKIKEVFPSAEVTESFRERVTYKIPSQAVSSLAAIFAALERGKETLHIEEYSFSQASLEQVFLEFARMQRADHDEDAGLSRHQVEMYRGAEAV